MKEPSVMTTERNSLPLTEQSNLCQEDRELRDEELDTVTGGLVVPSIIGILVGPGPLPSLKEPAPEKHWFNGG
jgi:hypothetical protein